MRSMAAAVAIGLPKMRSHWLNTKLLVMTRDRGFGARLLR
jgi:hypothetical protein